MKYLAFILFIFFSLRLVYPQEPIGAKQFLVGIDNVLSTDVVDHTIEPIGTYWELVDNVDWLVSSDTLGESSTIRTVGNSDFDRMGEWPGWNFFWVSGVDSPDTHWGLGFYKVTNDYNSEYFYIDCRVDAFGENGTGYNPPDFYVHLDAEDPSVYKHNADQDETWITIIDGEIVRIWDVHEVNPPSTNSLEDFWDNVLVAIDGGNGHPRFAWGPYNDNNYSVQNYKVYRAVNNSTNPPPLANFSLVATLSSSTYEWIDNSFALNGPMKAHYYIKAKIIPVLGPGFDSDASNIVTFSVGFYKESSKLLHSVQEFNLGQNYPNPFNPATIIQFSIKNKSFASLKVYDILGNEVAVLIENFLEAGNHSIDFDASDLPSGIYMYQLQAEGTILTKKMILLR